VKAGWVGEPNEGNCTAAGVELRKAKPGAACWPNKEVNILLPAALLEAAGALKPTVPPKTKPDPVAAGVPPQPVPFCWFHMVKRRVQSSDCCACARVHPHSFTAQLCLSSVTLLTAQRHNHAAPSGLRAPQHPTDDAKIGNPLG